MGIGGLRFHVILEVDSRLIHDSLNIDYGGDLGDFSRLTVDSETDLMSF